MTSKERMMLALHKEKPDRLPVTVHQWQPYHLNTYMDGMSELEAFALCGMDAAVTYVPLDEPQSPQWRVTARRTDHQDGWTVDYRIETPEGVLTTREGSNAATTWVEEYLIKEKEDIRLLKYRPIPVLRKNDVRAMYDKLGDGAFCAPS